MGHKFYDILAELAVGSILSAATIGCIGLLLKSIFWFIEIVGGIR